MKEMNLKQQLENETQAIMEMADGLTEKQLLSSIIYELKKLRSSVKSVEMELSVIKQQLKR